MLACYYSLRYVKSDAILERVINNETRLSRCRKITIKYSDRYKIKTQVASNR